MGLIQLSRPWTEQPHLAEPDLSNRFGIVGGLLHTASEFPARSFADGRHVTPSAGTLNSATVGMRPAPTPYGLAGRMYDDAGTARWVYWSQPALSAQNFTFLARLNVRRSLTAYQLVACRAGTAADGTPIPLWITSSGTWDMRINGTDYTAAGTASQNVWYDVEIVSSAAGATLYVNGAAVITGGAATAGTLPTVFSFGGCAGTTSALGADAIDLSYCLFANRALSVAELAEVRGNPWQLFAPRKAPIFYSLPAAASTQGLIQLSRPWTEQPQGVVEPVSEGVFSGPALLWNAATPRVNLANRAPPTGDGTGVSERCGPYGKEADFSGSGTGRYIFATAPEQDAVTIAIEARVDSTADLDRLVSAYNGAGSGKYDIYYENASGRWVWQSFRETTNGNHRFNSEVIGAFSGTLVVTCANLTGAPTAFFNGRPVSILTVTSGSGAVVAASSVFSIGGRADSTARQLDGGISTVWRLDRALPAPVARELSLPGAMPRLLYEPRRIYIPTQSAAAAAPTITALSARLITASSAQPRISYS